MIYTFLRKLRQTHRLCLFMVDKVEYLLKEAHQIKNIYLEFYYLMDDTFAWYKQQNMFSREVGRIKSLILDLSRGCSSFLNPWLTSGWCPFEVINAICTTQSGSHISQLVDPTGTSPEVLTTTCLGTSRAWLCALPATVRQLNVKFPAEAIN